LDQSDRAHSLIPKPSKDLNAGMAGRFKDKKNRECLPSNYTLVNISHHQALLMQTHLVRRGV